MSEQAPAQPIENNQPSEYSAAFGELNEAVKFADNVGALNHDDRSLVESRAPFPSNHIRIGIDNEDGTRTKVDTELGDQNYSMVGGTFVAKPGEKDSVYATTYGDSNNYAIGREGREDTGGNVWHGALEVDVTHLHENGDTTTNTLSGRNAERATEILMRRAARNIGNAATKSVMSKLEDRSKAA